MRVKSVLLWLFGTTILFLLILLFIPFLIGIFEAAGVSTDSSSDLVAIAALGVSIISFVSTLVWNVWVFEKTSDVYQPVLKFSLENHRYHKGLDRYEFEVIIENKGASTSIPSEIWLEGDWFDESVGYEPDFDILPPQGSSKLNIILEIPSLGSHQLKITYMDEEANLIWWQDFEFETKRKPYLR